MSASIMHRLQRSPFGWLALFASTSLALASLASCTLTAEDFEPSSTLAPSLDEGTDPLEPSSAAGPPGAEIDVTETDETDVTETDVAEGAEVAPTAESPRASDVPLAPSEPANAGDVTTDVGGEVDVGCSGEGCPAPAGACETAEDCESGVCASGLCQASSCSDAFQNADEAGVDCGGPACVPCPCTYGTPQPLGDPNYAGNSLYSPSLSPDGLTLYFGLYVLGGANETIAFSKRPSPAESFGLGNALPPSINAGVEGTPRLDPDNLTLYFSSERPGGLGGRDIYRAQRSAPGAAFDAVTPLTEINSSGTDHLPWVSADGLSMYFSSDRAGDHDIYRATRASRTVPWQPPQSVTELNTTAVDNGMTLTSDEREIVFASYRLGGSDFFRAVRAPGEATFGAPELLASMSSAADDTDPALSPDGTELYFSSTRDGTDSRIWRVFRTCP